jgi:Fe2+ transport system protein FeoA
MNAVNAMKCNSSEASFACPLSDVKAGMAVRIKRLCVADEVASRLREIGFCEDQVVRLLTSQTNIICLVCSARFALSTQLAQAIWVEPVMETIAA